TSMATPHVAGAIAAMYAAACPKMIDDYMAYPDSVALFVKQMLLEGTTPASTLFKRTSSGGVLNLYRAVTKMNEYNCNNCPFTLTDSVMQPACYDACTGSFTISIDSGKTFSYSETNVCPGFYPIIISDKNGCKEYKYVTVVQPDSIVINS